MVWFGMQVKARIKFLNLILEIYESEKKRNRIKKWHNGFLSIGWVVREQKLSDVRVGMGTQDVVVCKKVKSGVGGSLLSN